MNYSIRSLLAAPKALGAIVDPNAIHIPKGTPDSVVPTVLHIVFATAGAVSVLIIVIAGFRLILSVGNPDALNKARNAVVYAAIGLVVCIAGYTIVSFVVQHV